MWITFIANDVLISQNVNQFVYYIYFSIPSFAAWCSLLYQFDCRWLARSLCFTIFLFHLHSPFTMVDAIVTTAVVVWVYIYYKTILLPLALPLTIQFQNMESNQNSSTTTTIDDKSTNESDNYCGSTRAHTKEHHLYKYLCEEECAKNLSKFK